MRRRFPLMALALILILPLAAISQPGCALLGIGPKVDAGSEAFVVSAETSIRQAHVTCRAFLQLDADNRDFVSRELPAVHAVAEAMRKPDAATGLATELAANRRAFEAVQLYKATRSPGDRVTVEDRLKQVEDLAAAARRYMATISEKRLAAATRPA